MNIIAATATATPTRRSVTIIVENNGETTEHTETWMSPDLGRAIEFASELDSITRRLIGERIEWMVTEETTELITLALNNIPEDDEDDGEEWFFEDRPASIDE